MLQGLEGTAIEETGFDEVELAFDFALGLWPAYAARLRTEAVVRGEGEEFGIVERAVGIVTQHHRFEVIVEANTRNAAQVMEGVYVFTQRRRQVHRLDEVQVLPTRVAQQIAEEVHAPPAFTREVEIVDAVIHLRLRAWPGLKARHGRARRARTQQPDALAHDRVLAGEAACLQFLQGALGGEIRVLGEQFLQNRLERIDDALAWSRSGRWRGPAIALRLHTRQRAGHRTARDTQAVGNRAHRHPALAPLYDFVSHFFRHGILSRLKSGPNTNSATTPA